jgi:hypothetical protein
LTVQWLALSGFATVLGRKQHQYANVVHHLRSRRAALDANGALTRRLRTAVNIANAPELFSIML